MEAVPRDGYSITIPLLVDNDDKEQDKLCVKEAEGNTSFFKTCFNGLNALSASAPRHILEHEANDRTYLPVAAKFEMFGLYEIQTCGLKLKQRVDGQIMWDVVQGLRKVYKVSFASGNEKEFEPSMVIEISLSACV